VNRPPFLTDDKYIGKFILLLLRNELIFCVYLCLSIPDCSCSHSLFLWPFYGPLINCDVTLDIRDMISVPPEYVQQWTRLKRGVCCLQAPFQAKQSQQASYGSNLCWIANCLFARQQNKQQKGRSAWKIRRTKWNSDNQFGSERHWLTKYRSFPK